MAGGGIAPIRFTLVPDAVRPVCGLYSVVPRRQCLRQGLHIEVDFRCDVPCPVRVDRLVDGDLPDKPLEGIGVHLLDVGVLPYHLHPAAGVGGQLRLVGKLPLFFVQPRLEFRLFGLRLTHHHVEVLLGDAPGDHVLIELHHHALQNGQPFPVLHHLTGKGLGLLAFLCLADIGEAVKHLGIVHQRRRCRRPDFVEYLAVQLAILDPVLGAVVLAVLVVGDAGVDVLRVLGVCPADGQRLAALAALDDTGKEAECAVLLRTLAGAELLLHRLKVLRGDDGFVHPLHDDPFLRLFLADRPQLEAVVRLLGGDSARVDRVDEDVLDDCEIPDEPPVLRVGLFPFCEVAAETPLAVPPCGAGDLLFLQPPADVIRAMSGKGVVKDALHNGGSLFINEEVVPVLRVFAVAEGGNTAGELPFGGLEVIGCVDFLGNVAGIHLVQDSFEGRDLVVFPERVYIVVHGDIPHAMPGEVFLDQPAGFQIVPRETAEVFRDDQIDHAFLNGFQHPLEVRPVEVQPRVAIILENRHNLPSLLRAVAFQHTPLIGDRRALAILVIILREAAVDRRPVAAGKSGLDLPDTCCVRHSHLPT